MLEPRSSADQPIRRRDRDPISASPNAYNDMLMMLPHREQKLGQKIRRHVQFVFMNPMMKWRVRRQLPLKLALQVLKIVFITVQLVLFAKLRSSHVELLEDTQNVLRHKFLKSWRDDGDLLVRPSSGGRYAIYTSQEIIDHFAHAISAYYSIENDTFACLSYDSPAIYSSTFDHDSMDDFENAFVLSKLSHRIPSPELCISRVASVTVHNHTYNFDMSEYENCFLLNLTHDEVKQIEKSSLSLRQLFATRNITFKPEDSMIISTAILSFKLRTVHFSLKSIGQHSPNCYLISVDITFDNSHHTGVVYVQLFTRMSYMDECNSQVVKGGISDAWDIIVVVVDIFVLLICTLSFVLCGRALIRSNVLEEIVRNYVKEVLKKQFNLSDRLEFLNLWYVMILVNDIFIIVGTISKICTEFKEFDNSLFNTTGVLLGIGALLVYFGILRYFGFFSQYNVLILTLKKSLPNILRFMSCVAVLYIGFLVAGWVIIGPYSPKFRTLESSSEALFSLINGDDMFATFYTINSANSAIKIIGSIYLYLFVSLFIYVVLSLFIAIIMDAYEVVKERCEHGSKSDVSLLRTIINSDTRWESMNIQEVQKLFSKERMLDLGFCKFCNVLQCLLLRHTCSFYSVLHETEEYSDEELFEQETASFAQLNALSI